MAEGEASHGHERRKRLKAIRSNVGDGDTTKETGRASSSSEREGHPKATDLDAFLRQLKERKQQKKQQLQLIQEFFENPVKFGVQTDFNPSSTTLEEMRAHKKDLQYRIDLLKSILQAMEGEMQVLCQAAPDLVSASGDGQPGPLGVQGDSLSSRSKERPPSASELATTLKSERAREANTSRQQEETLCSSDIASPIMASARAGLSISVGIGVAVYSTPL